MKKVFILVAACALLLTGCSERGVKNFVSGYYEGWASGEVNVEKSYDDYISATSKELLGISRDTYISELTKGLNESNTQYKSISISSVKSYDDHIYKVKGDVQATVNGQEVSIPVADYIINEHGKYKFLQYGVSSKELVETSYSSEAFSMATDVMYTGVDRIMINLIAKNPTTTNYSIGYAGNGKIVVETDQGTYETLMPGMNIVRARQNNQGLQEIDGVRGTVKKITVTNVYELNVDNEPKDKANSRSYVIYEKQ